MQLTRFDGVAGLIGMRGREGRKEGKKKRIPPRGNNFEEESNEGSAPDR